MIPWGRWHPDREQVDGSPIVLKARNVLPVAAGFSPWKALEAFGHEVYIDRIVNGLETDYVVDSDGNYIVEGDSELTATVKVVGGVTAIDGDGNVQSFAGTQAKLYKL